MTVLSPRTWLLTSRIFAANAERAAGILELECGNNLPLCGDYTEYDLERLRFAALKISNGDLSLLQEAVDLAKRDWRDELVWADFANSRSAHEEWAREVLGKL
jgi:hypothetical protein